MFSQSARYYDLIYSQFKDYAAESAKVASFIRAASPSARTVLDVACGTGEHARILSQEHGFVVDGLDLDPAFVEIAKTKLDAGRVHLGDMTAFHLPDRYDVVLCLFSSIGYVRTLDRVRDALACFRDHLTPGGIVIVEPWFEPEAFAAGRFSVDVARADDVVVSRVSHTSVEGRISRIHFDYSIGNASGIEHASEQHELGLFTRAEMARAFADCGLKAEYDAAGLFGRGMYVARSA